MVLMEILGAEASVFDEISKVLANGNARALIIQTADAPDDDVTLENPNETTLRQVRENLSRFSNFELRSGTAQIGEEEILALHIIAS